jgi:hypothetical protein
MKVDRQIDVEQTAEQQTEGQTVKLSVCLSVHVSNCLSVHNLSYLETIKATDSRESPLAKLVAGGHIDAAVGAHGVLHALVVQFAVGVLVSAAVGTLV